MIRQIWPIACVSFVPKRVLGKFMHVTDQPLKRPSGKSLVYFMGAGFCPFCAAERWAIVKALERFGKWEGVVEDKSADHDEKYLNVPTFNLARAKYASDYVEFAGKETADRNFEPLQELDDKDYEILDMYNPDQMIPFLLVDGQYMQVGTGFSPELIQNMTHDKVKTELDNPNSQIGKAIRTEIDNITALLCKSTGGKGDACNADSIKTLTGKL
jgi:thiol-disulfide isomerase/thioredoxin